MESLPDEILVQILSGVPALDLAHARCVCKRWKTIMEEPLWQKLHFSCSISDPDNKVVVVQRGTDLCFVDFTNKSRASQDKTRACIPFMQSFLKIIRLTSESEPKAFQAKLSVCVPRMQSSFKILGSCNGFLCLINVITQTIYIKNPFTNEDMWQLPKLPRQENIMLCGFGYDSTTNIYKVVAMVTYGEYDDFDDDTRLYEIMVCDCGSMMNWRSMIGITPYCRELTRLTRHDYPTLTFVNGRLHWKYCTPYWGLVIVSFDFAEEEVKLIRIPDPLKCSIFQVIEFQNCLCLVQTDQRYTTIRVQTWIMEKYDVEDSWVKKSDTESSGLRIEIPFENCPERVLTRAIGEVGHGKILICFYTDGFRVMLLYEPMNNHKHKFFKCEDLPDYWDPKPSIHSPTLSRMPWML